MENKGIIGFYFKNGKTTFYVEDCYTYEKTYFEPIRGTIQSNEATNLLNKLKQMYPNYSVVEFRY